MNKLVFANLVHRPLRSLISVVAVAIEVIMILSIVGIFMGMLNDQKARTNGIGADLMMRGSNASDMNGVGPVSMPIKLADPLRKLPHVTVVAPVATSLVTSGALEIIWGIDYPTYNALKPFVFISGAPPKGGTPFRGPNDVIVDNVFAARKNPATGKLYALGDTDSILNTDFRICAIVQQSKGGRKLIPLDTMDRLIGAPGKASIFYLKLDNPANEQTVIDEIHSTPGLADYPVQTIEEWLSTMIPDKMPGFNLALDTVTTIAVIVGFLVIFQTMYTAVLERTREIGILKSMGASKPTIVGVVMRETAALAIVGLLLGIAGTFLVQYIILHFTTLQFQITPRWIAQGSAIAFAGSILGALYPAWMAARKDPIDALAYE
ncbi:MAG TPA: ABC transporter permease [Terracidiphilus sp.]|nr:ABC transporter permease [Terracidiphilus sp.]